MKLTPFSQLIPLATATLTFLTANFPAQAVSFQQQEVDQNQFIAIARPYGGNKYDLLILQQIPGKRQCWQESGSNPVLVNPLLLNFDFTGNCERSTDSNGYSIRLNGQDLGLDYLLRVIERNGELVLVGTSRRNGSSEEILIGRTHGLGQGFMKFDLDSGWRFAKRAYAGRTLSHVYLTGDRGAMTPAVTPNTRPLPSNTVNQSKPNIPATANSNPPASGKVMKELTFTAPNNAVPATPPSPAQLDSNQSLSPINHNLTNSAQEKTFINSSSPSIPSRRNPFKTSQSPSPINRNFANSSQEKMYASVTNSPLSPRSEQLNSNVPLPSINSNFGSSSQEKTVANVPTVSPRNYRNSNLLPPPPTPKILPSYSAGNQEQTMIPPNNLNTNNLNQNTLNPNNSSVNSYRSNTSLLNTSYRSANSYRVMAAVSGEDQQNQVRSLYPDAFSTSYNGQRVLQVGVFSTQENAQQAYQSLQNAGLQAIMIR